MTLGTTEIDPRLLEGARRTLDETAPLMIVEFHTPGLLAEGLSWLDGAGYRATSLTGEALPPGASPPRGRYPRNVLCHLPDSATHRERLAGLWTS